MVSNARPVALAPIPRDEVARLAELDAYQVVDTPEETLYDTFAALAREIAGTSGALITFVDDQRSWFKAHPGVALHEIAREQSFCAHVLSAGKPIMFADAATDERFRKNVLVLGEPHVRFYAGFPLMTPSGMSIGTLAVFDSTSRDLTQSQRLALETLARAIIDTLEDRKRYLALFDTANIDLFTIDVVHRTVLFASRGACERLGYALRELVAMPIYDVMPALLEEGYVEALAMVRSGESVVREATLRRRDGTTYPIELRIDLVHEGGEERLLAVAIDLSDRKAAQREIDLLLGAINVAGDVILVYRVDDDGVLQLAYMNDAYLAQSGYTRSEAIGHSIDSFRQSMPDDDGMRAIRAALAAGKPVEAEVISYRKDGSSYWNQVTMHPIIDASNHIGHWIAIERDITEEVNRTSALAEEHDRLLALTRAARRLFTALDTTALVATVRDVLRELLGAEARVLAVLDDGSALPVEELGVVAGETFRDDLITQALVSQTRAVEIRGDRAVSVAGRFGDSHYVLELRTPSGRQLRNTDLFVFDLVAEYFAVAARNVTLYHELDERRSAVLELNQTKSDLIAMLAHDFRGPLTSIVGFADLTSEVGGVNEEQRDFLETIKRSALQLSELATDTLTLSRLERNEVALQLADVDLQALLAAVSLQYADRRAVDLHAIGDVHVVGDTDRLRQVFSNLLDNAIKYSPNGPPPDIKIEAMGDFVTVSIADHGIGIPPGELSQVFDRFSRASNARRMRISGTGFGLFLTKQLVQLHGGTIAVESKEGEGSTFIVTLPRRVPRTSSPRTIIVLDPERDRSFLAYGLREAGYRVVTAASLEEVLGIADAQSVDALIVSIPETELANERAVQLRAFSRERAIPIIAVANETSPRLGAAATLLRPVLIGDVVAALERLVAAAPNAG